MGRIRDTIIENYRQSLLPALAAGNFNPKDWLYSPEDNRLTYRRDLLLTIRPAGNSYRLFFADEVVGEFLSELPLNAVQQTKSDAEVAREDAAIIADIEQAIAALRNRPPDGKTG